LNYKETLKKVFLSSILTIFIYTFYHIEFFRESVEDFSFDITNQFVLSSQEEKLNAPNLLLFKIDDNYLNEKKLLDENSETKYGYLFPRSYLAELISKFDILLEDIDKENYPNALFVDYDMSYKSDPHNLIYTQDDLKLIEILKKDRPYKIYLPKTANHNYIQNFDDEIIQNKIKDNKIVFVSVGLTISNDDISRRYYPYETYKSKDGKDIKYPLIEIEIFKEFKGLKENILDKFSQEKIAFIENRIIFKDYKEKEIIENSEFIQSKWNNLKLFSANYPLDYIPEENFRNSIIYLGGTHSNSDDTFVKDSFDRELSGIEMHANALMTMFYLNGKLNRLNILYAILIIASVVFTIDLIIQYLILKLSNKEKVSKFVEFFKNGGYIPFTFIVLFFISYYLLTDYKVWFNWFIPSLMTTIIPALTTTYNFFKHKNIKRVIYFLFFIFIFKWIINKLKQRKEQ
jgi:hypothetical protein